MDPEHRRQLAFLARKKGKRRVPREKLPCDWRPHAVMNPESGQYFTDAAAWDFVAELLEDAEQVVEVVVLDKPAGKAGYVMTRDLPAGKLYIKVHFGRGEIWGRSFHYSDYSNE